MGRALDRIVSARTGYDPEEEVPLVAIEDYLERVLFGVRELGPRDVPVGDAWGCVLASAVRAPGDMPPFTSSAMDGYAVRSSDIAHASGAAPAELRVVGEVRMGSASSAIVGAGEAVTVPTGGVVPDGADAVVPFELCERDGDRVLVLRRQPAGKHVRPVAEDVRAGDVLLPAGRVLTASDVGALAGAGLGTMSVIPRARVGVISTGDELVSPGEHLNGAQIYDSNGYLIAASVRDAGGEPTRADPVPDDPDALVAALDGLAGDVDAYVCSGGVSMGEHDPVKRAFEGGGEIGFVNVAMQPGRPQAFGTYRAKPFFGVPGNPVSVLVSFEVFVRPALAKMMGRRDDRVAVQAVLSRDVEGLRGRTRFARVRVHRDAERVVATPEGGYRSNLVATLARSDGLAVIPPGEGIAAGGTCRVLLLRTMLADDARDR